MYHLLLFVLHAVRQPDHKTCVALCLKKNERLDKTRGVDVSSLCAEQMVSLPFH